jgi:hypothetical protein
MFVTTDTARQRIWWRVAMTGTSTSHEVGPGDPEKADLRGRLELRPSHAA